MSVSEQAWADLLEPVHDPPKRRELDAPPPVVHPFRTPDGLELRLTRYRAGSKGPVVLTHGLGVSSRMFSTDTIDVNLLEFLSRAEYDVWLLDYRSSIELPSARTQFTADDVAAMDYPQAIQIVRDETGSETVQMVVHCYGATTFFMAMLAGLEGVRSAAVSQIATHMVTSKLSRFKAKMRLPEFLNLLNIDTMTAHVSDEPGVRERLFSAALRAQPLEEEEQCDNPVCHRVTFMYGLLYEHDQMSKTMHDEALHELFGVANISAMRHMALMVRRGGALRTADDRDAYLPHLDRLAIPTRFVHGAENACFHPRSTEITYDLLRERNGDDLYSRYVIPDHGHIDCMFGKNASKDVFPLVLEHLEDTQRV